MNVKILKVLLTTLVILTLTSCSKECTPRIEYVDRPYEVKVPVKCETPDVFCDFKRETHTEVLGAMLECIVDLKRSNEVCK